MKSKLFWLLVPVALFSMFSADSASAVSIEKRVAISNRTRIAVEPGIGHTIDFSGTSERVYRAWVGDGGQCLQVLGGSPLEEGTQIVNLRRFQCQNNSGFQPVGETVVTLTTQDAQGRLSVYEFIVRYSDTGESITRVVDTSFSEPLASSPGAARTALRVEAVKAGLETFALDADSTVAARVNEWAQLVETGTGYRLAALSVDIDWSLLERLNQIGIRAALVGSSDL